MKSSALYLNKGKARKTITDKNMSLRNLPVLGMIIALSGCVSAPPEVSASRPLIEKENVYTSTYATDEAAKEIANASSGELVTLQGKRYVVGQLYVSALGLDCRHLAFHSVDETRSIKKSLQDTVACSDNGRWFLVDPLMSGVRTQ